MTEARAAAPRAAQLNSRRRLRLFRAAVALVLIGEVLALLKLQVATDPKRFADIAARDQVTVKLPAVRGSITDRDGVLLAVTVDAKDVWADPELVTDPAAEAAALAPLLGADAATLAERMSWKPRRWVLLAKGVTPRMWQRISALQLPGIGADPSAERRYPEGSLAANLLGFTNVDGIGRGGVEMLADEVLAGTPGTRSYFSSSNAAPSDAAVVPAINGGSVRLTIDRDIQWVAQQAITTRVQQAKAESGTVIVMNVRTGEILAMATAPTFDPNDLKSANAADLGNRALSDAYEPGSVGKIMTVAAVLEEGTLNPDSKLRVPGALTRGDKTFHDHNKHGMLHLTLTGVLAKSSNIGSILASETIPGAKLYDYFKRFGIGDRTGLGFPGENPGSILAPRDWSVTTEPTFAFGQGYNVNALQAAMVFATIANGGVRVTPQLVAGYTTPAGKFSPAPTPTSSRVVSELTARKVSEMMESVVGEEGTAPTARIRGYRVAGKTGTAQLLDSTCACYNGYMASFIGIAPADQPQLVVAVSLVRPTGFSHFGGVLAGPVFKRVMSFALQQMRIPPSGSTEPTMKLTW